MERSDARAVVWQGQRENETSRDQPVPSSFEETCEHCFLIVLRYVMSRAGDEQAAEDLTIETFMRAQRGWTGFQRRSAVTTWLIGIARHVIADYRRQAGDKPVSLDQMAQELADGYGAAPEEAALRNAESALLERALGELTDADQELLALRYAAGLSLGEIGRVSGLREMTVRVRLHRARRRLRELLTAMETTA